MNQHTKNLTRSSLFLALAILFQFAGRSIPQVSQVFVGSAVNAVFIMTAVMCGLWWGVSLGLLTPLLAWIIGQLPAPMGPFIIFIMIGNSIFVIIFYSLKKYKKFGQIAGIVMGGFLKFLFLFLSASKLITLFKLGINPKLANTLIASMGIVQFITAVIGGIVALLLLNILKKRRQI